MTGEFIFWIFVTALWSAYWHGCYKKWKTPFKYEFQIVRFIDDEGVECFGLERRRAFKCLVPRVWHQIGTSRLFHEVQQRQDRELAVNLKQPKKRIVVQGPTRSQDSLRDVLTP